MSRRPTETKGKREIPGVSWKRVFGSSKTYSVESGEG